MLIKKTNLLLVRLLLVTIANSFGMEEESASNSTEVEIHAPHAKINTSSKRKDRQQESESDGYDKQVREPKKILVRVAETATALRPSTHVFQCSLCPTYFKDQIKNVRVHILSKHYDNAEARIKEILPNGLVKRLIEVKGVGKLHQCSKCERIYRVPYYLASHMKFRHGKEKKKAKPKVFVQKEKKSTQLITSEELLPEPIALASQTEKSDCFTPEELEQMFGLNEILSNLNQQ